MKYTRQHRIAAIIGGLILLALLIAIYRHAYELNTPEPSRRVLPGGQDSPAAGVPAKQVLADGRERALTQELPLLGRVTGTRWISGHRFRLRDEEQAAYWEHFATAPPPMDVLVDGEGYFLMARLNGERFATRPPADSLHRLIAGLFKPPGSADVPPRPAKVPLPPTKVTLPKIAWDDSALGEKILGMFHAGYRNEPSFGIAHLEESFTLVDVLVEGESSPRRIIVARYTEGLTAPRMGRHVNPAPDPLTGAIADTNIHGAFVTTRASLFPRDNGPKSQTMHLMEPWAAGCPWPQEKLDPVSGDNLLTEFILPAEYHQDMSDYFSPQETRYGQLERRQENATKRKAARLAQEAKARGDGQ